VALARGVGMRGAFVFPLYISEGNVIAFARFHSRENREPEDPAPLMQAIKLQSAPRSGSFRQRKQREEELRRFPHPMDVSRT